MSVLNDRPVSLSSLFSTTIIKHLANQSYYKLSEILRKNLRWLKYKNTLKDAFEKAYKTLCNQYNITTTIAIDVDKEINKYMQQKYCLREYIAQNGKATYHIFPCKCI